ncbi:hypothetical protein [Sphingomonas sp.]|uniref:hypothetical protein n=1 Tax=Sphingomonas sp. TaxID=28214 RepID=UPI002EDB9F64
MTDRLTAMLSRELAAAVPDEIASAAATLAEELGGVAVLFYGSVLRTGDLDGVLDFYVLTAAARGSPLRRAGLRWLWPDVSFHELHVGCRLVRAKVATMPIETFEQACRGAFVDTTVWTRFVQPAALVWQDGEGSAARVRTAIADAAITAARFAAALGAARGEPLDYWAALFRQTYRAELRVEAPGREREILRHDPARYAALLPAAWAADGIACDRTDGLLVPRLDPGRRRTIVRAWRKRARLGRPLNVARLVKAAFTFEGAARYGLWKVARHTGVDLPLTPWRERHPILAAPGVFWRVLRARRP